MSKKNHLINDENSRKSLSAMSFGANSSKKSNTFDDGSITFSSKDQNNPDSLFYQYIEGEQLRHLDTLNNLMEEVDDKVDILKKEIEKIDKLNHYRLIEPVTLPDFDSMPCRSENSTGAFERQYQSKMCKLIFYEITNLRNIVQNIKDDLTEGRVDEVLHKINNYEDRKGRYSEVEPARPENSFSD